jgi:hypothetical protein
MLVKARSGTLGLLSGTEQYQLGIIRITVSVLRQSLRMQRRTPVRNFQPATRNPEKAADTEARHPRYTLGFE